MNTGEQCLQFHPEIKAEFDKTFPVDVTPIVGQDGKKKAFTEAFFHMTPTVAGLTLLSKFQNNVKNAENLVVTFCHDQIGAVKVVYDQFAALVGQSSNYVMPGEEVKLLQVLARTVKQHSRRSVSMAHQFQLMLMEGLFISSRQVAAAPSMYRLMLLIQNPMEQKKQRLLMLNIPLELQVVQQ